MNYIKVTEANLEGNIWLFIWNRTQGNLFLGRRNAGKIIWVRYGDKNNYPDLRGVWEAVGCFMCREINLSLL